MPAFKVAIAIGHHRLRIAGGNPADRDAYSESVRSAVSRLEGIRSVAVIVSPSPEWSALSVELSRSGRQPVADPHALQTMRQRAESATCAALLSAVASIAGSRSGAMPG